MEPMIIPRGCGEWYERTITCEYGAVIGYGHCNYLAIFTPNMTLDKKTLILCEETQLERRFRCISLV